VVAIIIGTGLTIAFPSKHKEAAAMDGIPPRHQSQFLPWIDSAMRHR
jgi:hypothetical protein